MSEAMVDTLFEEVNANGNIQAVVECDEDVCYFYLVGTTDMPFEMKSVWVRNHGQAPDSLEVERMRSGAPPRPLSGRSRLPFGRDGRVHPTRAPFEYYPTPPEATRALLSMEEFDGPIWEPACGEGHISKVLVKAGYKVVSTDLILRGYGEGDVDFLRERDPRAKHIVTNPPYGRGLGDAFVLKALELTAETGGSVAMLLNLASLAHPSRHELWTGHPPAVIYALDELVCWPEGRPELARSSTATHRYCWVVWKPGFG